MNFTSKTFWILLGVSISTLSMGASSTEIHNQMQISESSAQKEKDPACTFVHHPTPSCPIHMSQGQKNELVGFLVDAVHIFKYPGMLYELINASEAEFMEIFESAQNQVNADRKIKMKIQTLAACLAVDNIECFSKLDAEIRRDVNFADLKEEYEKLAADTLFALPYARIGEIQEYVLYYVRTGILNPYWHLSDAIAHLNASQLRYLITFFDENNLDTSNINYDRIPGQVIENYKFLPTSQEDMKESIDLIKQIKGFNFEKLIQSIDSNVQKNKKSLFYSAKEVSELMAYKDALKMYWDLGKITESENK